MPLRFVRQALPTTWRSRLYYPSSSAIATVAAVAAPIPSTKLRIPFISTLRISVRYLRVAVAFVLIILCFAFGANSCLNARSAPKQADNLAKLRLDFLSVLF